MAEYKSGLTVTFKIDILMSEQEARALEALTKYGIDEFLKKFYTHLGSHYLKPHEDGLRMLFETIGKEIPKHLAKVDNARKAFKV